MNSYNIILYIQLNKIFIKILLIHKLAHEVTNTLLILFKKLHNLMTEIDYKKKKTRRMN